MTEAERAVLKRFRTVVGMIADDIDIDPDGCVVVIYAVGPNGPRQQVTKVSLADCFAEVDLLLGMTL